MGKIEMLGIYSFIYFFQHHPEIINSRIIVSLFSDKFVSFEITIVDMVMPATIFFCDPDAVWVLFNK